ncbi:MAG: type II toxin-antitoxin system VapC family toxin [Acidobacteriota bacterium]
MKSKIYVETTIVSYLTARPSRELIIEADQILTRDWWEHKRHVFDVYVSSMVLQEAMKGDPDASRKRVDLIETMPILALDEEGIELADRLVADRILPEKAHADALHLAIATVNRIDYLLTWNCKHLANAVLQKRLRHFMKRNRHELPQICTPRALMEI